MEMEGIELPANSASKSHFDGSRAQNAAHAGHAGPDLGAVLRAWPGLSTEQRERILEVVKGV